MLLLTKNWTGRVQGQRIPQPQQQPEGNVAWLGGGEEIRFGAYNSRRKLVVRSRLTGRGRANKRVLKGRPGGRMNGPLVSARILRRDIDGVVLVL